MKKIFILLACSVALYACNKCGVVHYEITTNINPAKQGYPVTKDSVTGELCGSEYEKARTYVSGDSARKVEVTTDGIYTMTTVTRIKSYGKE